MGVREHGKSQPFSYSTVKSLPKPVGEEKPLDLGN